MIDLPKAIHFVAIQDGKPLPPTDKLGLAARWAVAAQCRESITTMHRLSVTDLVKIGKIMAGENRRLEKVGVVIELATGRSQDEG
jgi:hypothetical protein